MSTNYLDNYYARLGVSKTATLDEVRDAFRRAARQLHPDTNKQTAANELFLQVQEAYDVLTDPSARARYDASLPDDIDGPPTLMINTLYSRSVVTPSANIQNIYVLLDLMAASGEADTASIRPPINVTLVLDTSTSMAGERLGKVLKAANQFIQQLQPYDILSIVTFNDKAEVIAQPRAGHDSQRLIAQLSSLQTSGGTEILQGLKLGIKQVQQTLNPAYTNQVVLITDGRTYGDEDDCLQLARKAADAGITVSAIGIGEEWNEDFIDALVSSTGGSSLYAARSSDIQQLVEEKLTSLNQSYANNVRLQCELGAGSELTYAFRLSPEAENLGTRSPLPFGNIPLGKSLSVLLEFQADYTKFKGENEYTLTEGTLHMDIPTRSIPTTKTRFRLSRPIGEVEASEGPPQVIVKAIGQLSLYRMQEEARTKIEAGHKEGAAKDLRMLATRLLSSGEKTLAKTVLLAADEVKDGQALGSKSGKQIKYGTRALIQEPHQGLDDS